MSLAITFTALICFYVATSGAGSPAPKPMYNNWEQASHLHSGDSYNLAPLPESLDFSAVPTHQGGYHPAEHDVSNLYGHQTFMQHHDHQYGTTGSYHDPSLQYHGTHNAAYTPIVQPSSSVDHTTQFTNQLYLPDSYDTHDTQAPFDTGYPSTFSPWSIPSEPSPELQISDYLVDPYESQEQQLHEETSNFHAWTQPEGWHNELPVHQQTTHHGSDIIHHQQGEGREARQKRKTNKAGSSSGKRSGDDSANVTLMATDALKEMEQFWFEFKTYMTAMNNVHYPPKDAYVPQEQYEYTFQYPPGYPAANSHGEVVYMNLSSELKFVCVEQIQRIRPYNEDNIRQNLRRKQGKAAVLNELLSRDQHRVEAMVENLYKDNSTQRDFVPWMKGLHNKDRIQVVEKLAGATFQSADKLRDVMVNMKLAPEVAVRILNARTLKEVRSIAREHNIYHLPDPSETWQKGTSEIQRKALYQRMAFHGGITQARILAILKKERIPEGYALYLLRVGDDEFRRILTWMKGKHAVRSYHGEVLRLHSFLPLD
ncbi:hypothetical protein CBS101457_000152 [Exobasidium rhododendri]|nr:hypothetical protein CBS101457_000152 [Exobasidium rhododendri]